MGIKVTGGVAAQAENEVLECREPSSSKSTPSQSTPSQTQNSVAPFRAQPGDAGAPPAGPVCEGPTLKASELQAQVELCKRAADLPLIGQLGAKHHWCCLPRSSTG